MAHRTWVLGILTTLCSFSLLGGCSRPPTLTIDEASQRKILAAEKHMLTFKKTGPGWTLANVEESNRRLDATEIEFVLDGVSLGTGQTGLDNLEGIIARMKRGTLFRAEHYLVCGKNRWAEKILKMRKRTRRRYGIDIQCDGAF
jgi:hypothetical protein